MGKVIPLGPKKLLIKDIIIEVYVDSEFSVGKVSRIFSNGFVGMLIS